MSLDNRFPRSKTGEWTLLKTVTLVTSASHFDSDHNRIQTSENLIKLEVDDQLVAYNIERLVEATRILMEAPEHDFDSEREDKVSESFEKINNGLIYTNCQDGYFQ